MKIGIDLDGVIYLWHWSIYRHFTEFRGYIGSQREFWNYFRELPKDLIEYFVLLPIFYTDTVPSSAILEGIDELSKLGELFYVTSRDISLESVTRKFLNKLNVAFHENLFFEKDKASFCRLNGIDYFIDDQIHHMVNMKSFVHCYLMAQPHNANDREGYNVVYGLKEFAQEIRNELK